MNLAHATRPESRAHLECGASDPFERELVALIPAVLTFARKLCRGHAVAEDMTQETLAKAWRARNTFEPGTNLKAWLFVILRNTIFSRTRRSWREMEWDPETEKEVPAPALEQEWSAQLSDVARALNGLTNGQRDAVILVGVAGYSYRDAANICGAPAGTIKSRFARGRACLFDILDGNEPMPARRHGNTTSGTDEIMQQLSVLTRRSQTGAGVHA